MKNLNKTDNTINALNKMSESDKKHDVNLKSNSSLYFQIGLILCLLATYALFEMEFQKSIPYFNMEKLSNDKADFYIPNIQIVPDEVKPMEEQRKQLAVLIIKPPVIKPDDFVINNQIDIITPESTTPVVSTTPNPTIVDEPTVIPIDKPFSMIDVEKVPIFPGCESASNNAERMACMSEKLTKFIQKKFNTDLAVDLGLSGIQRIQVQFRIDDKGRVTDIKTRSPYSQLENEAERVVSKIPVMTPGMQRNTPVSVVYNLPIAFQVH